MMWNWTSSDEVTLCSVSGAPPSLKIVQRLGRGAVRVGRVVEGPGFAVAEGLVAISGVGVSSMPDKRVVVRAARVVAGDDQLPVVLSAGGVIGTEVQIQAVCST